MAESRRLAAELIGAVPEEIALTINTGFGLSLAARALPLQAGDIVLASDREFPANVYPWMLLKDSGITLELAPTTDEGLARRELTCWSGSATRGSGCWRSRWCSSATDTPSIWLGSRPRPEPQGPIWWWTRSRGWDSCRWI